MRLPWLAAGSSCARDGVWRAQDEVTTIVVTIAASRNDREDRRETWEATASM